MQKNTRYLILLITAVSAISLLLSSNEETQFNEYKSWKQQYNVKFNSEVEQAYRQRVFFDNLAKIKLHNLKQDRTFDMGINQFAAYTHAEFVQRFLGKSRQFQTKKQVQVENKVLGDIDWTTQDAVTSVKNQGSCTAWWAFSATGAIQGLNKIQSGTLVAFSAQQLLDCSGGYGNFGCNGGLMNNAFMYVKSGGACHESEYPYKGSKQYCQKDGGYFKINGYYYSQ